MALHAQISFLASGRLNTLASKPNAHAAVRVWFRSFMVQKEQWYTSWGPKKLIFLIRDKDDAAMAGASVESCQFVVLRSPRGRLGSSRDMCNRLRRMRGRFQQWIAMRTGAQLPRGLHHDPPKFWIQSSLESTKNRRMRSRRPPDHRPIPERVRGPICIRKK